jgi:hypothetical protein
MLNVVPFAMYELEADDVYLLCNPQLNRGHDAPETHRSLKESFCSVIKRHALLNHFLHA